MQIKARDTLFQPISEINQKFHEEISQIKSEKAQEISQVEIEVWTATDHCFVHPLPGLKTHLALGESQSLKVVRLESQNGTAVKIVKQQWLFNTECRYLLALCTYLDHDCIETFAYSLIFHSTRNQLGVKS